MVASFLATLLVFIVGLQAVGQEREAGKNWKTVVADDFERREVGNQYVRTEKSKAGWTIEGGVLVGSQVRSDHGTVVRRMLDYGDVEFECRFRFADQQKNARFNLVFDDSKEKTVHSGHISRVSMSRFAVKLSDDQTGSMNLKIRDLRKLEERTKEQESKLEKTLKDTTLSKKVRLNDDKWHHLWVRIVGPKMSVKLDGKLIGTLDSPGNNHQTRDKYGFTVPTKRIEFDDLKLSVPVASKKEAIAPGKTGSPQKTAPKADAAEGKAVVPEGVSMLIENSCIGCHDSESKEGGLDLESLRWQLADAENFNSWAHIFDRVRDGEMPPDDEPDKNEKNQFLKELRQQLVASDAKRISAEGRVAARRLSRAQYERSLHELLGIEIPLQGILPPDSLSGGFDTVSESQQISDHLMAAYLRAADTALDAAIDGAVPNPDRYQVRLDWKQLRRSERRQDREPEGRPKHEDIVSWSTFQNFYGRMHATTVPKTGLYRIRVRLHSVNERDRIWCSFRSGLCSGKDSRFYWIGGIEATPKTEEHEFVAWIRAGHQLQLRPNESGQKKAQVRGENSIGSPRGTLEPLGIPGVAIKWIEMEELLPQTEEVRQAMFGDLEVRLQPQLELVSSDADRDLKELVRSFATRAFRRPVPDKELVPYFAFADETRKKTGSLLAGIKAAYRAILCSSRFLFFEELPGLLDDYALATRLSYFLWGAAPDRELRELADRNQLRDPQQLRVQTERLLNDPRSEAFVREFTDQWLKLYELEATTPDSKLYPEYDDVLHNSLTLETHAFVRELIDKDLSVTNVVDSDFTFLNSRLARHYKIAWSGGNGLKRVGLQPDDHRGGLITHASVLKVTANGTTTSPIVRGLWMLERIMGEHVPPPPANVPAVEPDIRGAMTIRDQLDKHRSLESCAACHVKIDPPGFALESYDVIGRYRKRYRDAPAEGDQKKRWIEGPRVDPSYSLGGEEFRDLQQLKEILRSEPEQLARSLASQLVTYATGASPTFADRDELTHIVKATQKKEHGVRSLIHEVIQSDMFRKK